MFHCDSRGTVDANSNENLKMEFKGSSEDFCTAVDLQNEERVTKAIQEHFPRTVSLEKNLLEQESLLYSQTMQRGLLTNYVITVERLVSHFP